MDNREAMVDSLERVVPVLSSLVRSIPASAIDLVRKEGAWSLSEHLNHLAEVQPMLLGRLQQFADEESPNVTPYHPPEGEERVTRRPVSEAIDEFCTYRARQLELLRGAPEEVWRRVGEHPGFTSYSFVILVRHILMHDYWHMYRMEELMLARDEYLTDL